MSRDDLGGHQFEEELNLDLALATGRPLAEIAKLRIDAGRVQSDHGDADRAVELLAQAVEDLCVLHGSDSDKVLDARGLLARALTAARRFTEAEEMLLDVLEERERRFGPDARLTLIARGNLCMAVRMSGRPAEALLLGQQLLADRIRILGERHPSTLDSMGHVAHALGSLGRPTEAAELFEEQGRLRAEVLGPDHPLVHQSRHNAATMRARVTEGAEVVAELERIVAQCVRDLGEDDAQTLTARGLLAEHLASVGDHERAVDLLGQLVEDRTRVLGPTHPATLVSRRQLLLSLGFHLRLPVPHEQVAQFVRDLLTRFPDAHADRVTGLVDMASVIGERFEDDPEPVDHDDLVAALRQMAALLLLADEDARKILEADHPGRRRAAAPLEEVLAVAEGLGALDPPVRIEEVWS